MSFQPTIIIIIIYIHRLYHRHVSAYRSPPRTTPPTGGSRLPSITASAATSFLGRGYYHCVPSSRAKQPSTTNLCRTHDLSLPQCRRAKETQSNFSYLQLTSCLLHPPSSSPSSSTSSAPSTSLTSRPLKTHHFPFTLPLSCSLRLLNGRVVQVWYRAQV